MLPGFFYRQKLDFLLFRYKYLLRYIFIGLSSIVVELLIIGVLPFAPVVSIPVGFLLAVVWAFFLNSRLNFPVSKEKNLQTFRTFLIISVFAFALNLALMKTVFTTYIPLQYYVARFITAGLIFMISYSLHRKLTFTETKEVGIAVYLNRAEKISEIKSKIKDYPDFIHIDLVDKSYNDKAKEVDLSLGRQIAREWPYTKKMLHIMSRRPTQWIEKSRDFADVIVFHAEIEEDVENVIKLCRKYGKKVGISILYNTNTENILRYLGEVDIVQVLGIEKPGVSQQRMNSLALEKLAAINHLQKKYGFEICFDGGVKLSNIGKIEAKYVVSASTVLNAEDSLKAIYDLKTSSRYYNHIEKDLKESITTGIKNIAESLDFVKSCTIVGSFNERGMDSISDIDVIVILDKLTGDKFEKTKKMFADLGNAIKADYDYDYIINSTLGPLKFNRKNCVVFHLMVYDVAGHINHCRESPFTCYDWQKSSLFFKAPMTSIYKVNSLKPDDFFSMRRGVKDYMKDIAAGAVSYREYKFSKGGVSEVKKLKEMDNKDKFEFSYHVMKFSMLNSIKLLEKNNIDFSDSVVRKFFDVFPRNMEKYESFLSTLRKYKDLNEYPEWTSKQKELLLSFVTDFETQFRDFFGSKMFFVRHQETKMNQKGLFLGRLDPEIISPQKSDIARLASLASSNKIQHFFSSPSKRCVQTAEHVRKSAKIQRLITDNNLYEIDYGALDGKDYNHLRANYPNIIRDWEKGKDPKFPKGENLADVSSRLDRFLSSSQSNSMIFTHSVVMKCLIGKQLGLPLNQWHKLEISHLDPVEVVRAKNGQLYLNLRPEQENSILKGLNI